MSLFYYLVFYGGPLATIDNGGWTNVVIDRDREIARIKLIACSLNYILLNFSQRKPRHQPLEQVALALEWVNLLRNLLCHGIGACRMMMWVVTIQPYYHTPTGQEFSPCWNGLAGFMSKKIRLIDLKRHIDDFSKGPELNRTDRTQKRRSFLVNSISSFRHNDKVALFNSVPFYAYQPDMWKSVAGHLTSIKGLII